jgi:Porin PorA
MRGVIGAILAGLGAFLIVAAILLPTWVTSQVVKFPLNESETATLQATNASYFSQTTLKPVTGATLQATYTISGNPAKGSSSTAVWTQDDTVTDLTNHQPVQKVTRTVAFDRRTGQLVNCCGANVNGNAKIVQAGLVGYVFPFNTQKQTYMVFDATTDKPEPYVYSGTTTVHGITVYKFEDNVAPTLVTTLTVPGSLVGSKDASVKVGEFDELHLIYYVDPETGALLNVNDHEIVTGHISTGGTLVLYDSDLIPTPASLNTIVGLDSSGRSELALLTTTLPLVFGIVGGVALIAGIFLGRTGRKRDDAAELDGVVPAAATGD